MYCSTAEKVFKDTDVLFEELKSNLERPVSVVEHVCPASPSSAANLDVRSEHFPVHTYRVMPWDASMQCAASVDVVCINFPYIMGV
jgi:hypothetical protein